MTDLTALRLCEMEVSDLRKVLIDCIHAIERLDKVVPGGLDTAERTVLRKAIAMWERESGRV